MKIHELRPADGSKQSPKRLGRGTGSGLGKVGVQVLDGQQPTLGVGSSEFCRVAGLGVLPVRFTTDNIAPSIGGRADEVAPVNRESFLNNHHSSSLCGRDGRAVGVLCFVDTALDLGPCDRAVAINR